MKNVIAVIWDCDKTLIDGYMQDPMFAEYGVETKQFWRMKIKFWMNTRKPACGSIATPII